MVLLDVRMHGMDGFETARHVRSRERSRHTPIIFLTADDEGRSSLEEAYSLGAVDYLVKPLVPAVLRAKVAAFVDLFRQKERAEREADQLRLLVQGTTDYAIFMLDPEGRVATWNAGAERIKGYAAEEIVGQHFSRFYPQEALDRGWPAEELRRAEADGPVRGRGLAGPQGRLDVLGQRRHHRPAGRGRSPAGVLQSHPRPDRAEEAGGGVAPAPPRPGEAGRGTHRRPGGQQRGVAGGERRAERAEEALREADRRKDQFVMMLAHELRNPLAPIRNAVQVIRTPDADRPAVEKAGGMVERQVGHLTRIVDDLLDVSRVQSGKMSLRPERLDLGPARPHRPRRPAAGVRPGGRCPSKRTCRNCRSGWTATRPG